MLGKTEKSSDVCRTASLSEMGHKQRAATSSTVTEQRRKNFFVRKSSFAIEVPPNRRVLRNGHPYRLNLYGWRALAVAGPTVWNGVCDTISETRSSVLTCSDAPYLTLPSGEDVLPSSAEASNWHPQINRKVTKSPSVVLTWVHTNNGTIPPMQLRTPTWAHPLSHSQYLRENIRCSWKTFRF